MKHVSITITGRVQGVFFRAGTQHEAERLGITGNVHNEIDGSVKIEAEGDAKKLEEFIRWCHEGPPDAMVDSVKVEGGGLKGYDRFEIRYD